MKKSIYKITNTINGKVYIGQSTDCERRFGEHQHDKSHTSAIHNAIVKYGVDAFTLEVIEKDIENYNEREKYWVKYYKSAEPKFGYNITPGGDEPPIISGEDSYLAKFSNDTINCVIDDLLNTNKSFLQISSEYNITPEYLSFINRGISRKQNDLNYPLRKNGNERLDKTLVSNICNDLIYTGLSIEGIARKYDIDSNTIYIINNGLHYYSPKELNYPIRKTFCRLSEELIKTLINELSSSQYKMCEIADKYNLSYVFLSRFNRGKIYKQDGIEYPIRSSKNRVY